ncbi:MAG: hypothetical protein R6U68_06300 [Desulfobacteraceae bacterium]
MENRSWSEQLKQYKKLFVIVIIGFFLIEIEIFAFALIKSGRNSFVQVLNNDNEVIYEVKGASLSNFNKYYFENNFGDLKDYRIRLKTEETPFPFRAWFSAAVGIPVGLVLLLAFILKAVMVFINGRDGPNVDKNSGEKDSGTRVENMLLRISSYNIFIIGFIVFACIFLFWVVPDLLTFLGKAGIETILRFKWFFLAGFLGFFLLFAWFMYMKYLLAKKSMESELMIKKHQLSLEYGNSGLKQLPEFSHNPVSPMKPQIGDHGDADNRNDRNEYP